jgi:hypothetical protein
MSAALYAGKMTLTVGALPSGCVCPTIILNILIRPPA